jgi:hypothetical protein
MIRHATDDSPACESRSWRRKGKFQVSCQKEGEGTPLRPRPAITDSHTIQFHTWISNRRTPYLETRPRHLTSSHQPPTSNYNTTHRGLTTPSAPLRAPRINLPLRPPQHAIAHLSRNNLPKTQHGSPTAPLPPAHQTLLPSKTLRLGEQISRLKSKTRPQPLAPINRRRHDASNPIIGTISNPTSTLTITTTTTPPPSTLSLVPLRRRTMQLRRRAAIAAQSDRDHHRTTPSHALAAAARNVPISAGFNPALAPMSEVVGGARRRGKRTEIGESAAKPAESRFQEFAGSGGG